MKTPSPSAFRREPARPSASRSAEPRRRPSLSRILLLFLLAPALKTGSLRAQEIPEDWNGFLPEDLQNFRVVQVNDHAYDVSFSVVKKHPYDSFSGFFAFERLAGGSYAELFLTSRIGIIQFDDCEVVRETDDRAELAFRYHLPEREPAGQFLPVLYLRIWSEEGSAAVDYRVFLKDLFDWDELPLRNPWDPGAPNTADPGDTWFNKPVGTPSEDFVFSSNPDVEAPDWGRLTTTTEPDVSKGFVPGDLHDFRVRRITNIHSSFEVSFAVTKNFPDDTFSGYFNFWRLQEDGNYVPGVGPITKRMAFDSCHLVRETNGRAEFAFRYDLPEGEQPGQFLPALQLQVSSRWGPSAADYGVYLEDLYDWEVWEDDPFIVRGDPWDFDNQNLSNPGDTWFNKPDGSPLPDADYSTDPDIGTRNDWGRLTTTRVAGPPEYPDSADLNPPVLEAIELSEDTLDVTDGPAELQITMRITDDLSGLDVARGFYVDLVDPAQEELESDDGFGLESTVERLSGDARDGMYKVALTLPRHLMVGEWKVLVILADKAENWRTYGPLESESDPVPNPASRSVTVTNSGSQDLQPPAIEEIQLSAHTFDVANSPAELRVSLQITDDVSGLDVGSEYTSISLFAPEASWSGDRVLSAPLERMSGDAQNGTYVAILSIPRGSAAGVWTLSAELSDHVGHHEYDAPLPSAANASVEVIGGTVDPLDTEAPVVEVIGLSAVTLDVENGPARLEATLRITDNISGVDTDAFSMWISIWPYGQYNELSWGPDTIVRQSGSANDGIYVATLTVPGHLIPGYAPLHMEVADRASNYREYGCGSDCAEPFPGEYKSIKVVHAGGAPASLPTGYEQFARQLGLDPSVDLPWLDRDGDGLTNIIEWVTGGSLLTPERDRSSLRLVQDPAGPAAASLRFTVAPYLTVIRDGDWLEIYSASGDTVPVRLSGQTSASLLQWQLSSPQSIGPSTFEVRTPSGQVGFARLISQ